jgi:hypothetical protein
MDCCLSVVQRHKALRAPLRLTSIILILSSVTRTNIANPSGSFDQHRYDLVPDVGQGSICVLAAIVHIKLTAYGQHPVQRLVITHCGTDFRWNSVT